MFVLDGEEVQVFDGNGTYLRTFADSGDGALTYGYWSIALDDQGISYVTDNSANTVRKYDSTGAFLQTIGHLGTVDGRLQDPRFLALCPDGNLYVADGSNDRVEVFTPTGDYVAQWKIASPSGIAFDSAGRAYVTIYNGIARFVLGA